MEQFPSILDTHPYLRQTLDLVSDKWITAIIYVLSRGKRRYGELQREIGGVSQRMLTRTLRNLEKDGLVRREEFTTPSLMVEYSLTPLGETLVEPLQSLCQWSVDYFDEVRRARESNPSQ
ncbi:helix-turn-helix transcriptional regulator [Leptolyngbya cf. ectocarpi LEGE 11479]|uniref:Helix-turn-helix transcriptional regulator n=1 Tax=Leptolyngbya cf. ectocarpi LEGE 11479 TaxID=1828722 RepID=A0A928ZWN3_LEPEC|nr:helix-turn-helix domain-containing protein [Leptolyngbya ectocarpi]MBE9068793.1 helix-turn-helix transcriptional regulator [Leptolyngbya cf. ectocarpi LEGE 11479]